jgi:hypothetical protein
MKVAACIYNICATISLAVRMAGTRPWDGRTERSQQGLEGKPVGRRKRGKPRTRCIENVEDDLRKMGIKRWRLTTADRRDWRGISEVARVVQEL